MLLPLSKPNLFGFDEEANLVLKGARCRCGHIFFPPQPHGCERCGHAVSHPVPLRGCGTLVASAAVHIHSRPGRVAPFTAGTIRLADGPIVRALMHGKQEDMSPGRPVTAMLVPIEPGDKQVLDLRFVAARGAISA